MVLVFFLAPKTGTGLSCTIYKIPVNFSLSLDLKPALVIQTNGTKNFRLFGKNRKKVRPRKVLLFPENSYRDEPFHLNCLRNFLVFHTNGKRSLSKLNLIRNPGMFCLWNSESLGYGIPNTAQRIWNPANDWNPEYKFY